MEMWSMPTTREVGRDLGRDLARAIGCSSERIAGERIAGEKTAGFLWSQRPGYRIVSRSSETDKPVRDGQVGGETMGSMSKTLGALALASGALFAGDAPAGTLDQIRDSKTMRIAYDPDAPPYSYIVPGSPTNADPQGYSVELCRGVFDNIRQQLKIPDMKIVYVAVNSQNRFDAITGNKADLLSRRRRRRC